MDEIERRVAALELAFYETMAWVDRDALSDAGRSISAGLEAEIDADERAIRQGALELIGLALNRFHSHSGR